MDISAGIVSDVLVGVGIVLVGTRVVVNVSASVGIVGSGVVMDISALGAGGGPRHADHPDGSLDVLESGELRGRNADQGKG